MRQKERVRRARQRGVMLIEGLIAILIFSLGILALVGLQSAAVRQTTDARYRIDASFLANQIIGRIWNDRANIASYAVEDQEVDELPNGKKTVEVSGNQVTVTITWQLPGETRSHRYSVIAQINGQDAGG